MSSQISEFNPKKQKVVVYAQYWVPGLVGGDKSLNEAKEDDKEVFSVLEGFFRGLMIGEGEVTISGRNNNGKVDYFCVKMGEYERGSMPTVEQAKERVYSIIQELLNSSRRVDDIEMYYRRGIF